MKHRIGNHRRAVLSWACAGVFVLLLAGCGYNFAGRGGESVYPAVKTLYVDTFINKTSEANLENIFRSAFNSEIVQNGRFKLAGSLEESDAVLRATIQALVAAPISYKPSNLAAEDRITVVMDLVLEDGKSAKPLWSSYGFSLTGDYTITSVGVTEVSRRNALVKLASDSAEKVYRLMMSDF
jgi:outer membrane lipopolysaccharide assembly protein LptE/RlpB